MNAVLSTHTTSPHAWSTPHTTPSPTTPLPTTPSPTTPSPTTQERDARALLATPSSPLPVGTVPAEDRLGLTAALHVQRSGSGAIAREVYAAIDLGSSSGKLLLLRRTPSGWKTLVDRKIGCALGKGVNNGAPIPAENMDRAVAALKSFVANAAAHGVTVDDIPMITTAVVRNAPNGEDFVARVRAEVGLLPRVLSGEEEADLGFCGALSALAATPGRYATLDLGGGSFQLAIGTHEGMQDGGSTQVGSNHVLDAWINPRVPSDGVVDDATFAFVDAELDRIAPLPLPPEDIRGRTLVATGGVSKFLRIHLGKDFVTRDEVDALRRQLGALPIAARAAFVQRGKTEEQKEALGIGTRDGAADYGKKLPASMSLLLHILDSLGCDTVRVSATDARHALIHQQARAAARALPDLP